MATTTMTQLAGPDVCVQKTEEIDVEFAQWIVSTKSISKEERDAVRKLLKDHLKDGNKHDTTYKLGKDIRHEDLGRWIATRTTGLQNTRARFAQV